MKVAGRMLLRDEERVKIPEAGLNITVGWHLLKAHFEENLAEFMTNFVKGM